MTRRPLLVALVLVALVAPAHADDETLEQAAEAARLEKLLDEGDAKVKAKAYDEAKPLYKRVVNETGKAPITQAARGRIGLRAVYASAANFALAGEKENAHGTLAWLPKLGFTAWEKLAKDPAFASLHEDAEWKKLLAAHAPAAHAGPSHEYLDTRLYRSVDGATVLALPDHEGWTVEHSGPNGLRFYLGDAKTWTARVTLDMGQGRSARGGETDLELAKEIAVTLARECQKNNPWLESKDDWKGRGIKVASGTPGWQVLIAGADPKQGKWSCAVVGLAHQARATAAVIWTTPAGESKAYPFAQKLMEALRQGDQVPKLAPRDPGTALEGVWRGHYSLNYGSGSVGGTQHWFVFDKRGYASWDDSPSSERYLDVEMLHQSGAAVYAYTVKGDKIELTRLDTKKTETLSWKRVDERTIEVDEKPHVRLDGGVTNGAKLSGRWEASSYYSAPNGYTATFSASTSSSYIFAPDGTFKSGSTVTANYTDTTRPDVLAGSNQSDKGHYEIQDDRVHLTYSNGVKATFTFYVHRIEPGKKPPFNVDIIYVSGSNYLRDKKWK